jgi:Ca2+-binding EF-hand superfamily protein
VKHGIGIVGVVVLGASFLFACSDSAPNADTGGSDLTTYVAALSVNGDGSDEVSSMETGDTMSREPLAARACGFGEIVANVVARYDADQSGDLDEAEKAALATEFGDREAGVTAENPNRGQPTRAGVLLEAYDVDGSGTLEASEIAALRADIQARCEERLSKLIEQFDTNGDGTLDDAEWDAARTALRERIAERRQSRVAEFDSNADGHLDAEERATLRKTILDRRAEVVAEFDSDGDGQLSEEERAELQDHLRACVKTDLPMDSREVAIEHRTHGQPDGIGRGEGEDSADEAVDTTSPPVTDDTSSDGADAEGENPEAAH